MKKNMRGCMLFVILAILVSSCGGSTEEPSEVTSPDLEDVIPLTIESSDAFDTLLINASFSNDDLEEILKPPGPIEKGFLRTWQSDEESLIYAMVIEFIYEADAEEAFDDFYADLEKENEEKSQEEYYYEDLGIGDQSVIYYTNFNLAVVAVRNGYYFVFTGSAILTEDAPSPDIALVVGLADECNLNLLSSQAGSSNHEIKESEANGEMVGFREQEVLTPIKVMPQQALFSNSMPQKTETFTIQLNREGKNNGYMKVGVITKLLSRKETKCNYEIETYLREIKAIDDGDDWLRGNGDVITYFKFNTICGVLEYRTSDIAPEGGVQSGKIMDFTVKGTSEGRMITSYTCKVDCKTTCTYRVYCYARDVDTNDGLEITAVILTLGIRISNQPEGLKIINDLEKLNKLLRDKGLPEKSSLPGSNLLGETRKIYGNALGEGNSEYKKINIPQEPSTEPVPQQPQETEAAVDCSLYGVVPGNPDMLQDDLNLLGDALSESYGCPVNLEAIPESEEILDMLENGQADFAWISIYDYVRFQGTTWPTPIGIPNNEYHGAGYHAMIVARADSGFENLGDLEGAYLGYTIPGDFVGVTLPRLMLLSEGYDPDAFFYLTTPLGYDPLQMFSVLLDGGVDAVVTWTSDYRDPREDVVDSLPDIWDATTVISTSPWIPQALIVSSAGERETEALKNALFELSDSNALYGLYQTTDMIEIEGTDYYGSLIWLDYWWVELDYDLGGWPD